VARHEAELLAADLKTALAARESFLSIASKELKAPLTALKLLCRAEERDPSLLRHVEHLNRIVEDMLDVSRMGSGKLDLNIEMIDLRMLVQEVLERQAYGGEPARSRIAFVASGPVIGLWDRHRIQQTVVNLISNASKYGGGMPVTITVEERAENAILMVKDQGLGLAPDQTERIFERFERVPSASKTPGLGLGLFIVRNIVSQHQGTVRVESELGKGSTFIVKLPLAALESQQAI